MAESRENKRGKSKKRKVELTEVEWEIMRIVWEKEPCAAGTVQEELSLRRTPYNGTQGKAYSTVKTTMDRMVEKGLLQIEKVRNVQLFKSCVSEVEAKRGEFQKMLTRAFNGALTPMMQFLFEHEGISKEEASKLRALANKTDGGKEKNEIA